MPLEIFLQYYDEHEIPYQLSQISVYNLVLNNIKRPKFNILFRKEQCFTQIKNKDKNPNLLHQPCEEI